MFPRVFSLKRSKSQEKPRGAEAGVSAAPSSITESLAYLAGPILVEAGKTGAVYFSSNDPIHNGDCYSSL